MDSFPSALHIPPGPERKSILTNVAIKAIRRDGARIYEHSSRLWVKPLIEGPFSAQRYSIYGENYVVLATADWAKPPNFAIQSPTRSGGRTWRGDLLILAEHQTHLGHFINLDIHDRGLLKVLEHMEEHGNRLSATTRLHEGVLYTNIVNISRPA